MDSIDSSIKDSEYINKVRENLIPRGSVRPHPADWKGKHNKIPPIRKGGPASAVFTEDTKSPRRKQRTQKLTPKQIAQAQYMLEGYSIRQARLKAGYSQSFADHKGLDTQKGVIKYVDSMRQKLAQEGMDDDYIAGKFKEWMDAKKVVSARIIMKGSDGDADSKTDDFIDVPDYDIQIKAYDRFEKLMHVGNKEPGGQKKREITLTEYLAEDSSE